jgi:hypothetical protein
MPTCKQKIGRVISCNPLPRRLVYDCMFRPLLSTAALIGGAICFLGGSAAHLNRLSLPVVSGHHLVGGGLLLLGVILLMRGTG